MEVCMGLRKGGEVILIEQFLSRPSAIPVTHPSGCFLRFKQMRKMGAQRRHSGPSADINHLLLRRLDMKIAERADGAHRITRLKLEEIARADAGRDVPSGWRHGNTNIEPKAALGRAVAGNRIIISTSFLWIAGDAIKSVFLLPLRSEQLWNIELTKGDHVISRDIDLQIVTRGKRDHSIFVQRFQDQFFDKGCYVLIAHHPKGNRFGRAGASTSRLADIQKQFSRACFERIGRQTSANRSPRRRAVREMKPAIMFRAFDDVSLHQPVTEMRIAMGASAVQGKKFPFMITNERVGLLAMVEADDVVTAQP